VRTYRVKRAVDVLAHAADDLGIKKLSQFVREIHSGWRLPIITVIPSAVEGSPWKLSQTFAADPST
jgi:hypothetical protein